MAWNLVIPMLLVAILAVATMPVAIVLHNVFSALIGAEEAVTFIVALVVAPVGITVGTLGAAATLRADARFAAVGSSLALAGAGLLLFSAYTIFALVVTTLAGGNPPYQAPIESVVVPVASAEAVGGALLAAVTFAMRPRVLA